jgi:hypothetical protein
MNNIVPYDFNVVKAIATTAHASGLYNTVGGEAKILMILLAAQDLGIKPTIALNGGIWNIQGKIEISARLMTAMIRQRGHSIKIKQCDHNGCVLIGTRADNGDIVECSFTIQDAQKAGLASRDVWKKYTEDMLYARALSRLARRAFADVIGTAYVEGEIRDIETINIAQSKEEEGIEALQIEELKEDKQKEEYKLLQDFIAQYPDEKVEDVETYLAVLRDSWKKPLSYVIDKCRNHEKFIDGFSNWKVKNNRQETKVA